MTRRHTTIGRPGIAALALCLWALPVAAGDRSQADVSYDSVAIAPVAEALTFARIGEPDAYRVLAVTSYAGGTVSGVDLSRALGRPAADAITLYHAEGYAALQSLIEGAAPDSRVAVRAGALALPVDLHTHHIAAGTNYREHAGESGVKDGPFLFAKLVEPTGPYAAVPAGEALLDYETELAWVVMAPVARGERPETLGLLLCNDFTDRAALLRHIDVWDVESGTGFTTGKSFPGYLPVGNLFVVPREPRAFAESLVLRLFVNGELRQQSPVSETIWKLDDLLAETWARADTRWEHRGRQVSLLGEPSVLLARTLLLSGTPSGTVFQGVSLAQQLAGAARWLAGGWGTPLPRHVVETYIRDARDEGIYLAPGDRVTVHVERLGVLDNEVIR